MLYIEDKIKMACRNLKSFYKTTVAAVEIEGV
jgi:hypothetical protein